MAHPCFECGCECYCNGDIDDVIVSKTPKRCEGCGCYEMLDDSDVDFAEDADEDEDNFIRCSMCDGHDACADFGCAFELGLDHLVKTDPEL